MKPRFSAFPRTSPALAALFLPVLSLSQPLWAATVVWSNTGTVFNTGANWVGGIAPGAADTATFNNAKVTDPALSGPAAVQGLVFSTATASGYSISGSTLTLGSAGIDMSALAGGINTISSSLTLTGGQAWNVGAGSSLALTTGTFTRGAGATLNLQGGGTFATSMPGLANTNGIIGSWASVGTGGNIRFATLSGANLVAYTGATVNANWVSTMNSGTTNYDVGAASATTFGASTRTANTVRYLGATDTLTLGNTNSGAQLITNGLINAGTGTLNLVNGTGSLTAAGLAAGSSNEVVLNAANAAINVSARVHNNGTTASAVTVAGPNLVTFSGVNDYTGATNISGGSLLVSGAGSNNNSSGITINGGKLTHTSSVASTPAISLLSGTLDGTGTVGAVTVANNPSAIVTNGNGGTTPLTASALTFTGAATLNLNRASTTPLAVSGTLATTPANGQVVINVPNSLPNGLVNLVSFGTFGGNASDFSANLTGLGARQIAGAPQVSGNNIAVNITGESIVWTGLTGYSWDIFPSGDNSAPNSWTRKTAQTETNFWTSDSVEFNDTYNIGSGNVGVTEDYIQIGADVSPASVIFNNNSVSYTIDSFSNGIAGGSLTKNGTGTTTLIGTHAYTGSTTINGGTLKLGNEVADGTIANTSSVANNATLLYYWTTNHTAPYPISGSGSLVKEGGATLTLTGANTSTGSTTITTGAITLTGGGGLGSGALGVASGANLNLGKTIALGQTVTGGGTITDTGGTATLSGNFSGFSGTYQHSSGTSSTVLAATTAASASAAYVITTGTASSQGIISNITSGDNTIQLGSLSGVVNSLVRNGAAVTGTTTFQIGNLNTNTEFAGTVGGGGGTLALTKTGSGTLTLSGPCTYNGATLVSGGTLAFSTSIQALGTSAFTVADGAGLDVKAVAAGSTLLTTNSLALGSTGTTNLTFNFNSLNPTVPQITTGLLTVNGGINLSLLNANALATGSYKLIDYSSLDGGGSLPGGSINVGNRATATIVNNILETSIDLNVSADTPKWTGLDNGDWVAGTTGSNKNWKLGIAGTATDYLESDMVLFDDSASGITNIVINTAVNPLATTFNNSSKAYSLSGSAGIAAGSLTKSGSGTTTILTTNTYTGPTTINAGTLQLGNGTVDGTIAGTSSIANNGTLAYNWAGTWTAPYAISGSGNLTKAGAGTLTLSGNNLYSGGTTITGGTLTVNGAGTPGTGTISVGSGTTLNINKNLALTNTVTGSGAILNTGATTVTGDFSGFSGTVTHNNELVSLGINTANSTSQNAAYHIASAQGSAQGMITAGNGDYTLKLGALSGVENSLFRGGNTATGITTLEIGNLGTSTDFAGSISNGVTKTLALSKVGGGTLTLSGINAYSGATIIYTGALNVTGSLASGSVVTVNSGAILKGTGTVAGTVIAGGTVAPGTSAGTLTTGPATLTGTLAIEIDGATGDKLVSTGTINLSGCTLTVTPLAGGFTQPSYIIAEGTSITGPFASVPSGYAVNIVTGGVGQQAVLTSTGSGYASWAATNAGGQTANLDSDLDGVKNGVEYFMNAPAGFTSNPSVVTGAVTWPNGGKIPASAYGTQFVVQTSGNLITWSNVLAGNLTTNTDGPGGSLKYTLPTGQGKTFVRLSVTPN